MLDIEVNSLTPEADQRLLLESVQSNTEMLQQLLNQFAELKHQVADHSPTPLGDSEHSVADYESSDVSSQVCSQCESLQDSINDLQRRINDLLNENDELRQQSSDLASQVASTNVKQTVAGRDSCSSDALSWEDRKQLILQQMESDSFDAESFVADLQTEVETQRTEDDEAAPFDPSQYLDQLHEELKRKTAELERKEKEIRELQCMLDEQSSTRDDGTAIGAAAIAQMIDSDELVQQERERLKQLQADWEEKFRQCEIDASLERAKMSRERLELSRKNAELEEQLAHLRREAQSDEESGATSRKWLAKLGLADKNQS